MKEVSDTLAKPDKTYSDNGGIYSGIYSDLSKIDENVRKMTIKEIAEALKSLRLDHYAGSFEENSIDGEILSSLGVNDLVEELSMKKIEAVRLRKFVESGHIPK